MRECTFPYEHTVNGEATVSEVRMQFYPPTLAEFKGTDPASMARKAGKLKEGMAPTGEPWITTLLVQRIHALPDFTDEKGKPFPITIESLDALSIVNLRSMEMAILENSVPKSAPSS